MSTKQQSVLPDEDEVGGYYKREDRKKKHKN